jgi:DNA-binding NtrC family response regulator
MRRLLLIEDEDVIRRALVRFLERKQFIVTDVATIEEAVLTPLHTFDLVLSDLRLPGAPGTAIIADVAPTPVVIMTSHASVRSAVDVMQEGATDYIAKPFDHDELLLVLERALHRDRLGIRIAALERDLSRLIPSSRRVDGTSLESVVKRIVHPQTHRNPDAPLRHFLFGPPGCGREGVARAAHATGSRAEGPLVIVNLAKLDGSERRQIAELDTTQTTQGLRDARRGTLILRYPDLLDEDTQRALVENTKATDVSLICLAERSVDELVSDGALHAAFAGLFDAQDCQHRIAPLQERPDDVLVHARRVIDTTSGRCGRPAPQLDDAALAWLQTRQWPGEVLELEAMLVRATLLVDRRTLGIADLEGSSAATGAAPSLDGYFRWFVEFHQQSLSETELAARLGISRKALWERRQRSDLLRPNKPEPADR